MFEPHRSGSEQLGGESVRYLFSTRHGGVSAPPFGALNLGAAVGDDPARVTANRAGVAASAGIAGDRVVWMHQVHGTVVRRVDGATDHPVGADGIVTAAKGLALAVLVADCVPVLLADPVTGVIGAAHAGRRGAAAGIGVRVVHEMTALGAGVGSIEVLLGPAICGPCYEVPAGLQAEVEAELPGSASTTLAATPALDLRAGLARQFRGLGVRSVTVDPRCTRTDPDLFSHRAGTPTGRFAGLIWRRQ